MLSFVTLELESGHLKVRFRFCEIERIFTTVDDSYSDGDQHLVEYYRKGDIFKFFVDRDLVHSENVPSNCNFNAQYLYFGGKTPQISSGRKRRDTSILRNGTVDDFSSVIPYKGSIQDAQLQQFSLQFYPLQEPSLSDLNPLPMSTSSGLTQDERSDPVCDLISPCENNSTCSDVFFNDYR